MARTYHHYREEQPRYNPEAVNKAIAAERRRGHRVSNREAKAIHALLKGWR